MFSLSSPALAIKPALEFDWLFIGVYRQMYLLNFTSITTLLTHTQCLTPDTNLCWWSAVGGDLVISQECVTVVGVVVRELT